MLGGTMMNPNNIAEALTMFMKLFKEMSIN
jgi:hypothetical protein